MPHAAFWLVLGVMLLPGRLALGEEVYTVRRGDTLSSIARRYGIAPSALAERNGLSRNNFIYSGQRLRIPKKAAPARSPAAKAAPPPKVAPMVLPKSVQQAIDRAPVKRGRWDYIIIHHSGTDVGTVQSMDKYHREVRHMEHGLAYHFVIGNGNGMADGQITVSRRWTQQLDGGHLASESQNQRALGICLVGNFDQRPPTARELTSLRVLIEALLKRCELTPSAVKTHQQINVVHTRCPGAKFPTRAFLDSLQPPRK